MNSILEFRNMVRIEIREEIIAKEGIKALGKAIESLYNINEHVNILVLITHLKSVTT